MVLFHLLRFMIPQSSLQIKEVFVEEASVNLNIEHEDFDEWIEIREPKGDVNRQCLNLHQCVVVGDKFMRRLEDGDSEDRRRWGKVLQKEKKTGEPYVMYKGNVNKQNPPMYKDNGLKVFMTKYLF